MCRLVILLFTLLFLFSENIYAQKKVLSFDHILYNKDVFEVYEIKKDSRGFIWIGTNHGLHTYNGYELKKYPTVLDSLNRGDTRVMGIFEDKQNNLWVASHEGLLKIELKSGKSKLYATSPQPNKGPSIKFCSSVIGDGNGVLWIATLEGLNKFDTRTEKFYVYKHNPSDKRSISSNLISRSFIDSKGTLWIGTGNGLNRFNPQENNFTKYLNDSINLESKKNEAINDIKEYDGSLWISTSAGLNRFNRQTGTFKLYDFGKQPAFINSINRDKRGHIWITSSESGLYDFDPVKENYVQYSHQPNNNQSLQSNAILTSYLDDNELLWLGSPYGIDLLNLNNKNFDAYYFDKSTIGIAGLGQDSAGNVWVGYEGTLSALDLKSGAEVYHQNNPSLFDHGPHSLTFDKYGWLWFNVAVRNQSLRKLNPKTNKFHVYDSEKEGLSHAQVWTIYKDKRENFWIGGNNGLNKYQFETDQFKHYLHDGKNKETITDNGVGPIVEASDGSFWVGTIHGLNKFNPVTEKFERFYNDPKSKESLSDNSIISLYEDRKANIWIGTHNGLNKFNKKNRTFERFKISDNSILSITEDHSGNLWINTSYSLVQFNPNTFKSKIFNDRDGLPKHIRAGVKGYGQNRDLFFGSTEGIVVAFHPDSIEMNKNKPPIVITDFQIFNKSIIPGKNSILSLPISETKEINITHKDSYFTFEFVALNYVAPERNQYAYKLEGYDDNWHYVGSKRFATYSNLDPGRYSFLVKGSNNDGVWNETGVSLSVNISPAFWQTWWFKILESLAVLGLLFLLYKVRTKRIIRKFKENEILKDKINRELEEKVDERTAAFKEANLQIEKMNALLQLDNKKLETDVKDISKARVTQKMLTFEEFEKIYPSEDACYQYIFDIKWKDGYICKKCSNTKFSKGPIPYSLQCNKCTYIETVTANTIFNKLKFPIVKAMYILAVVKTGHKFSIKELSETLNLRAATCIGFVKKAKEAIATTKAPKGKDDWSYLIHKNS